MAHDEKGKTGGSLPLEKMRWWAGSLEKSISQLPEADQRQLMQEPGCRCAEMILDMCGRHLGRTPADIADLIEGWNRLRGSLGLHGNWRLQGEGASAEFKECGCGLVRTGMLELHPSRCWCSHAMLEAIFQKVAGRTMKVEILQAIGRGDRSCRFQITPA
jgi:predicted hydrocarbon binding protein